MLRFKYLNSFNVFFYYNCLILLHSYHNEFVNFPQCAFSKNKHPNSLKGLIYIAKQRPKKSAVCIGDPNEIRLAFEFNCSFTLRFGHSVATFSLWSLPLPLLTSNLRPSLKISPLEIFFVSGSFLVRIS